MRVHQWLRQRVERLPVRRVEWIVGREFVHAGVESRLIGIIEPMHNRWRVRVDCHSNADLLSLLAGKRSCRMPTPTGPLQDEFWSSARLIKPQSRQHTRLKR